MCEDDSEGDYRLGFRCLLLTQHYTSHEKIAVGSIKGKKCYLTIVSSKKGLQLCDKKTSSNYDKDHMFLIFFPKCHPVVTINIT